MVQNALMLLTSEHLRSDAQNVPIVDLTVWDFKNTILPLKMALNTEIIVFQDGHGNAKILKNKHGVRGTLINNNLLSHEGWINHFGTNYFQKAGQTITLREGPRFNLRTVLTNEDVLQVSTLYLCQYGHTEPLKTVSTIEELRAFYNPEDFIIHDNYLS